MIARALQNTGWLMGARGVNAVLSLVYLALVTRALGVTGFGQFILCVTFAQAVVGMASFQTWQAVVRWGHSADTTGEHAGYREAVGFALALDLLSVLTGVLAAAALLALAGDWLPVPPELRPATFGLALVSLLAIRSTPIGILRLADRYRRAALAEAATPLVRAAGALIATLVAPTIVTFLIVWALAEAATAAAFWLAASRTRAISFRALSLTRLPRAAPGAWRFVFGTGLSGILAITSRQLLVLLVGALGGAAMAGLYRVAAQLGEALLKLGQALLRATYPEFVRAGEGAAAMATRLTQLAILTGIAALAAALVAGDALIAAVAGPGFAAAYLPMILLTAAAALELGGASLESLLLSRGRAMLNFALRAIPTLAALAALAWLIERFGASGPALAVLLASALTVIGLVLATRRRA